MIDYKEEMLEKIEVIDFEAKVITHKCKKRLLNYLHKSLQIY